jgi:metabotropic glutamate receptor 2/3
MKNVSVAINLSLNILLMFISTCYAFLTRNFPRNFNEAKFIGITMYLSCSIWIVFLPCYLNATDAIWKSVFASFAFFFIATITLGGLLVPRVFLVIKGATVGPETLTMTMQSGNTKQNDLSLEQVGGNTARERYEPNGGVLRSKDELPKIESITSK